MKLESLIKKGQEVLEKEEWTFEDILTMRKILKEVKQISVASFAQVNGWIEEDRWPGPSEKDSEGFIAILEGSLLILKGTDLIQKRGYEQLKEAGIDPEAVKKLLEKAFGKVGN